MRLIIEITYHSNARWPFLRNAASPRRRRRRRRRAWRRGRKKGAKTKGGGWYGRRRASVSGWRSMCTYERARVRVRADRVLFVCASPRRGPLISRFREIIRGGCVISFLVISCSTRRGMPRVFTSLGVRVCVGRARIIGRDDERVPSHLQGRWRKRRETRDRDALAIVKQIAKEKFLHFNRLI